MEGGASGGAEGTGGGHATPKSRDHAAIGLWKTRTIRRLCPVRDRRGVSADSGRREDLKRPLEPTEAAGWPKKRSLLAEERGHLAAVNGRIERVV